MTYGKRPPLDEQKSLWEASLAQEGVTTDAGTAAGDNFIDAGLKGAGATSFVSMLAVLYPGQPLLVDSMDITAFDNATGKVTLAKAYKGVAEVIPAGVPYKIVTFRFVPAEVAAIEAKLDNGTYGLSALNADLDTLLTRVTAAVALASVCTEARLAELGPTNIPADTDPKVMGKSQIATTTIDLDVGIGTYDLFTGTAQVVILESLNIKLPTGAPGGTLTSISIQTDDATPGVIISAADGAVANLLTEADLGWTGTLYITVGTKIQLSILGGPSVADYICNVTAKCRAVVSGGYLT